LSTYAHLLRSAAAIAIMAVIIYYFFHFHGSSDYNPVLAFALMSGALFGIVLQRSRFCFYCILRDFFEKKDGKPLVGIVTALIVGSVGYLILFESWISDPGAGYIPDDAHIGPSGWHLVLGGLTFGWGMVLSGSCISAHFYRIGEGSLLAPIALSGTVIGFILGFMSWNTLYISTISDSSVIWLPESLGYSGALILQLVVLIVFLIWLLVRFNPETDEAPEHYPVNSLSSLYKKIFIDRWPSWAGGIGVGLLSIFYYLRVEPLGVTAEINRIARMSDLTIIPERLEGLDGLAGCTPDMGPDLFTTNGLFVIAIVGGALFSGLLSGKFRIKPVSFLKVLKALLGGVLLGFGAMISLGCTIGTTLSGIHAFALSGWIFTLFMMLGVWSGLKIRLN
jgi:uncharacterized protein